MGVFSRYLKKGVRNKVEERIPARCCATKESFDILLGYENGILTMLQGERRYTADEISTNYGNDPKAGYKKIVLPNGLNTGRTYHCPVCGNKDIVRCNTCRRITCYDGKGSFICAYCGISGKVSGTMDSIEAYDNSDIKQDDVHYYPGDKGDKVV